MRITGSGGNEVSGLVYTGEIAVGANWAETDPRGNVRRERKGAARRRVCVCGGGGGEEWGGMESRGGRGTVE